MRVILKSGIIVLAPENEAELQAFASWKTAFDGHVFRLGAAPSHTSGLLHDLGPQAEACREPINISYSVEPQWRPISNFALAPFFLDGRHYASTEGFWQGLKFEKESDRRRIAALYGAEAKRAAEPAVPTAHIDYQGRQIAYASQDHWALMHRACQAKFESNAAAREALLSTGQRWLMHRMRRDSCSIPGAIMADIWMQIRDHLRNVQPTPAWKKTSRSASSAADTHP